MSPSPVVHGISISWEPGSAWALGPSMVVAPAISADCTVAQSGVTFTDACRTMSTNGVPGTGTCPKMRTPAEVTSHVVGADSETAQLSVFENESLTNDR